MVWQKFLFGNEINELDELTSFKFRFLAVLMLSGALFTSIFIFAEAIKFNRIPGPHFISMCIFTLGTTVLWLCLRGRPHWIFSIAVLYEILCLLEDSSALIFVPWDTLRVLWFLVNIPGVYIVLGKRAGAIVSLITITGLVLGNNHLSVPYSDNALATLLLSTAYLAIVFHAYSDRSVSFFLSMQEANRQLRYVADHDMLTSVFNARAYYQQCDALIRLANRDNRPYSVLFVDLDHFKRVNDTYGHEAGDTVLKCAAQCIKSNLRQSDVLGRIGGEEFSILLPDTKKDDAIKVAESLRIKIEALVPNHANQPIPITASIGVATADGRQIKMADLQKYADTAMYHAKSAGRNRVSTI